MTTVTFWNHSDVRGGSATPRRECRAIPPTSSSELRPASPQSALRSWSHTTESYKWRLRYTCVLRGTLPLLVCTHPCRVPALRIRTRIPYLCSPIILLHADCLRVEAANNNKVHCKILGNRVIRQFSFSKWLESIGRCFRTIRIFYGLIFPLIFHQVQSFISSVTIISRTSGLSWVWYECKCLDFSKYKLRSRVYNCE